MTDWKNWFRERKTHCRNVAVILAATGVILIAGSADGWRILPEVARDADVVDVQATRPAEEAEPLGKLEEMLLPMQTENGQWGYVDMNGKVVIFPQYDEAGPFTEEGVALVTAGRKTGYIDKTGKWVIGPKAKDEYFDFGTITELSVNPIAMEASGIEKEMLAPFLVCGRTGLVDAQGKVAVPFQYSYISEIMEIGIRKIAIALKEDEGGEESFYGMIDSEGNVTAPFEYDDIYGFEEKNRFIFSKDDMYGIMDADGTIIAEPEYDYLYVSNLYQETDYLLAEKDGYYGVVDLQGNVIVPFDYSSGDTVTQDDGDIQGSPIYFLLGEELGVFFCSNGRLMTLDYTGFDSYSTRNNFIVVEQDGRYGVLDNQGKPLTEMVFDDIYPPDQKGSSLVVQGGYWGVIDRTGKTVVECTYDDIYYYDSSGLAQAEKNGRWGLINRKGEVVVPIEFEGVLTMAEIAESSYSVVPRDIAQSGYSMAMWGDTLAVYNKSGERVGSVTDDEEDQDYADIAFLSLVNDLYGTDTDYGYTREELDKIFLGVEEASDDGIIYELDEETGYYITYDEDKDAYGLCDGDYNILAEAEYDSLYASSIKGIFYTDKYDDWENEYTEGAISIVDGKAYMVPAEYETVIVLENGLIDCRRGGTSMLMNKYGNWVMRAYEPLDAE